MDMVVSRQIFYLWLTAVALRQANSSLVPLLLYICKLLPHRCTIVQHSNFDGHSLLANCNYIYSGLEVEQNILVARKTNKQA